jgi:hypothetical protein
MTEDSILKIINKLQAKKSTGSDGISVRFIKTFKFALIPYLLHIINISIGNSHVPQVWKIARVTAIHKSGPKKKNQTIDQSQTYQFSAKFWQKTFKSHFLNI